MKNLLPFKLPVKKNSHHRPFWDGSHFRVDSKLVKVLEYSENFSGWSDDLTKLHEDSIGSNHPIDVASRSFTLSQIKKYIKPQHKVVMEIGCSSGFLLKELADNFPDKVIIGSDVVKKPLYQLAKKLPHVPLIRFDLLKCPLPNNCVDVLIMLNVLEHINDDFKALQNAFKLIKPGGIIILEVPAGKYLYDAYDKELKHYRRYSLFELKHKVNLSGFLIKKASHLGFLIFPAFAVVKFFNKIFLGNKKALVQKQASKTNDSVFLKLAISFEKNYLSEISLPFGVRAVLTAKKPQSKNVTHDF